MGLANRFGTGTGLEGTKGLRKHTMSPFRHRVENQH